VTDDGKQEKVSISESIGASTITKNLSCITSGFKMVDIYAIDPITQKPLCCSC
jgi:hypothetical protein